MSADRIPWNKGKKNEVKLLNYTNGTKNIKVKEGELPPDGFYRGQVRHMSEDDFKKSKKIQVEKTKQTLISRYGSTSYNNQEKKKKTCLDKYGVENFVESDIFKEKNKETCLNRYGVENVMQSEEVQERLKESLINLFGVDNISKLESNKQKIKESWSKKTEEELQEIQNKRIQTNKDKYGVDYYQKTEECLEKIRTTCNERYGVDYYTLTKDLRTSYNSQDSKPNMEFKELLDKSDIAYEREFIIDRKAYDFIVGNTLIEINPTVTHNSTTNIFDKNPVEKDYHRKKTLLAIENGYRCINVWDWDNKEKIVSLLKKRDKIGARLCECKEISIADANNFLSIYHLQGVIKSKRAFALVYNNEIVSVMTFDKPRYNKKYDYELIRFASSHMIIGGSKKLFKYSVEQLCANSIVSYCDYNKFDGHTYTDLGFKHIRTSIGKHWYNIKTKQHITDNLLRQLGFDKLLGDVYGYFGKGSSNEELMKQFNFVEIYDSGQGTYIWTNK